MTVVVVTGPTASGKTALAIALAQRLGCEIISADSRQIFRDIPIVTAAPTAEQLAAVKHHLIAMLPLDGYYSAAQFEEDALRIIEEAKAKGEEYMVVCGGAMLYVDALCYGIDDLPTISPDIRDKVHAIAATEGLEGLRERLEKLDPEYLAEADTNNRRRLAHALEICLQSGHKYSSLRTRRSPAGTSHLSLVTSHSQRPFCIVKIAIGWPRQQLFERINARVEAMMRVGLEEEAHRVYPLRRLNSLNTVGLKELFAYFEGGFPTAQEAAARIAKNTRVYAKKQLTWLRRDPSIHWLAPEDALEEAYRLAIAQ